MTIELANICMLYKHVLEKAKKHIFKQCEKFDSKFDFSKSHCTTSTRVKKIQVIRIQSAIARKNRIDSQI